MDMGIIAGTKLHYRRRLLDVRVSTMLVILCVPKPRSKICRRAQLGWRWAIPLTCWVLRSPFK